MTLEVPNLFVILAFAFFFGPLLILTLYGCLASFWRVKRKKKERQHETFVTGYEEEGDDTYFEHENMETICYQEEDEEE